MPHLILEVPEYFELAVAKNIISISEEFLVKTLPTKLEIFKSRIYSYLACSIGGNSSKGLIHLQIRVLGGREQNHLSKISIDLKNFILDQLIATGQGQYNLTLEIIELSPAYAN